MNGSERKLYILFSATPYRMGSWIRYVTGEHYNHVSIATDETLNTMYSFARRYYHAPFYGGFVTEGAYRYHHKGETADIQLYRLPLNREQWKMLNRILVEMQQAPDHYLYNHLSVLTAPMHWKVQVKDAYTCAEFVVSILSTLGFPFDPDRFYTIGDIAQPLEKYLIYSGAFPTQASADSEFYNRNNAPHPLYLSARDFGRLCWRVAEESVQSVYLLGRRIIG